MIDWLTVTSYIQINSKNKEKLIKIINDLRELDAISIDNYQTLISSAEIVQ
jgi:hypothetical protein